MNASTIHARVDEIFSLYEKHGAEDYIGEPVSQLEHMSQCAQLAEKEGCDEEVILAAFFHDIGHICGQYTAEEDMDGYGKMRHEKIGADFLRSRGFSEKMAQLVENHVQAKRYLCARKPRYYQALSDASKKTLEYQGGLMTVQEIVAFEADPLFDLSIKMRVWDELAKKENEPLPELNRYRNMAVQHLQQQPITV